jgi:transposase
MACQKLKAIPGEGATTTGTIEITVREGKEFKNGRQLSVWVELVPKQYISSGRQLLPGIIVTDELKPD